jgi:hypothetical protein
MLLIETEKCLGCKFFKEGLLARCKNPRVIDLEPGGVFNYYYADIANCKCECRFFKVKTKITSFNRQTNG